MNLLEYVQSLGSDISLEEKIALTKNWKKKNEPAETIVEEVKIDPVVETDATASGKNDGASANLDSGDSELNTELQTPDPFNLKTSFQKAFDSKEGVSLGQLQTMLDDNKKSLYGDVKYIPGQTVDGDDGFEYKYEIVEDGDEKYREFYFKRYKDKEWTNQSKRLKKNPKSNSLNNQMVGILSRLGFASEEAGKQAYKIEKKNKAIREKNKEIRKTNAKILAERKRQNTSGYYNESDFNNYNLRSSGSEEPNFSKVKNNKLTIPNFFGNSLMNSDDYEQAKETSESAGFIYGGNKTAKEKALAKIRYEDLDLENPYLYFNKNNNTNFINEFYGGEKSIAAINANPLDFEGFLIENGFDEDFKDDVKAGKFNVNFAGGSSAPPPSVVKEQKKLNLLKQRQLQGYLNLYMQEKDYRFNEKQSLLKIIDNPDDYSKYNATISNSRGSFLKLPAYNENEAVTTFNYQNYNTISQVLFPDAFKADEVIKENKIAFNKKLEQRGDTASAILSTLNGLKEIPLGFLEEAAGFKNWGLDVLGFDRAADISRGFKAEREREQSAFQSFTTFKGKTLEIDNINYAVDEDGTLWNVDKNFSVAGDPESDKKIKEQVLKDGVEKEHNSFRGYAFTGGRVGGGLILQVVGTKGLTKARLLAQTRVGAAINGFGLNTKKYKNYIALAEAVGGKKPPTFKAPIKMGTVDNIIFQGSYGAVSSYENIYAQAKSNGLNDEEANDLATSGSIATGIWYAGTGPINDKGKWFDDIFDTANVKNIINKSLAAYRKDGYKGFIENFKGGLLKLGQGSAKAFEQGAAETGQENLQQGGETLINKYLNNTYNVDFLDDFYSNEEIKSTSILSFATAGILSRIKMPNFKKGGPGNLVDLSYLGDNATQAEAILQSFVQNGKATQQEIDDLMADVRAAHNQTPLIPKWLNESYTLDVARLMQQKQDLLNEKKSTPFKEQQQEIDDKIENIELEIDAFVRQSADEARAKLQKGVNVFVEAVAKASSNNVDMVNLDSTAEANAYRQEMQDKGNTVYQSDNYGDFVIDGETGDITVIIDDQVNTEDNVVTTEVHEGGHLLVSATVKKDPTAATKLGNSLLEELSNSSNITINNNRVAAKIADYVSKGVSTADVMEEIMMFTSEALINGDIVFNETAKTKIGDVIRRTLQNVFGIKVKFKDGESVINFLRDYNKTIESGKASKGLVKTAVEGGEVTIKDSNIDAAKNLGRTEVVLNEETGVAEEVEVQPVVEKKLSKASQRVYQEVESMKSDLLNSSKKKDAAITAAYSLVDEAKRRMRNINLNEDVIDDIARTFALDEKRGLIGLINKWTPDRNDSVMGYLNSKSASGRSLFDARLQEFYEADPRYNEIIQSESQEGVTEKMQRQTATEQDVEVATKPAKRKIKPSSLISSNAVDKIKEQVQEKIKGIDPKNLTFKKLGDLAPEIIAKEIGIPVKKLTVPAANLSKTDATAIQQFVNKNADKLLKILPEGAVVEAATEKLLGTSTGVPKGLLEAFYTKKARLGKGAGLSPFVLNKGITKAKFLEAFGIVDGKKQEGFKARSSQAQALKGIANLYGRLVTNEIVRSDTDLSLETKQDVAAGKNKSMASKRFEFNIDTARAISATAYGVKLVKKIATRITSKGKTVKIKITDLDSKEMKEFTSVVNDFLEKNPKYGPYFRQGYTGTKQTHTYGLVSIFDKYVPGFKDAKKLITRLAYSKSRFQSKRTIDKAIPTLKADNKARMDLLKNMALDIEAFLAIKGNKNKAYVFEQFFKDGSRDQNHPLRYLIPLKFATVNPVNLSLNVNEEVTEEHTSPVVGIGRLIVDAAKNGNVEQVFAEVIEPSAAQGGLLRSIDENMSSALKQDQANEFYETVLQLNKEGKLDSVNEALWYIRYSIENDVNPFSLMLLEKGITVGEYFLGKSEISKVGLIETQAIANDLINQVLTGKITQKQAKAQFKIQQSQLLPGKVLASKRDSGLIPNAIKYDKPITVQTAINALEKTDKALNNARKLDAPVKKIRVFDFDDTLAKSKSMVIVNMPDGSSKKINATQFAQQASDLESQGAEFDFTEFSKVVEGKKGPLFEVAQKIADARGTEDVFILTARPQNADGPIKAFMKANGIDIPLKNITGLSDGTAEAKAGWIMGKAAEGYNDFYFADDAIKNVQAVKDVLSQIDVKSEVQLAKASKRTTFDTIVNDMIEDSAGIETYKKYSAARAKTVGANKGKFNFFIPASAEDFTGLLYKMLGKGKKGDAQMAFLKTNLLDPYDRAESAVTQAKIAAANDFKALKQNLKTLPKSLSKPTGVGGFTFSHAVRVAVWSKQGMSIPGLSKKDIKELNDFVDNNAELSVFTDELMKIQKGKPYPKPGDNWLGGNITSDIINGINKVNRAEYQQEWRENVDIIFSEDNMNKMEAAYGTRWREAMEDSLRRMKSGSNRPPGGNRVTDGLLDWLNNSVGAVMFLNTRSALLQTISSVNFINWGDNNIVKAGLAFANQKQFWGDFMTLMNSDYLVERRNGLKINVSESEIADAVRDSKNKVKSAIALLLSKGFVMTRFADSFAIATGGASFYRNRVKALVAKGMDQKAAEKQAFDDFRQIAEESQQSSNPNRISAQQASGAGRVILAWANTPMQYARIQKRAAQDLINGRGDWKTNVSKIVYYGAVQNLIFNALQQAVFALGFGEDDEEEMDAKKSEKISRVANGMIDSQLKGLGIGGAAVVALKTALMELGKQHAKDRSKYEEAVFDLLGFSPPLGSKIQKINSGLRSFSWNMKDIKSKGFSLDNPAYLAGAQITTGLTNIPLDRVIKKLNSMRGIVNEQSALWQKVALGLGWSTWDVGLGYYGGFDAAKVLTPEEQAIEDVITMKKETKTKEQVDMLLDLGLTKKEIKALGKEQARVEKIIELQKAEVTPEVKTEVKVENVKEELKVKIKPKNESAERKLRRQFDSIKDENKPDQVKTLLKFGLSKKEIRALQYEKNRVNKILELMNK